MRVRVQTVLARSLVCNDAFLLLRRRDAAAARKLAMPAYWLLLIGLLLVLMAFVGSAMDKLPMTPGLIYLLIGYALGPAALDLVALDPMRETQVLGVLAEAVVVISLFA